MFEKFFAPKSQEQIKKSLEQIVEKELLKEINSQTIQTAFEKIQEENEEKNYGFTDDRLLKILRDCALEQSSTAQDHDFAGVHFEVDRLRENLTPEKKAS